VLDILPPDAMSTQLRRSLVFPQASERIFFSGARLHSRRIAVPVPFG
jgi:hypothetical protein